jgi:hypothetical protein
MSCMTRSRIFIKSQVTSVEKFVYLWCVVCTCLCVCIILLRSGDCYVYIRKSGSVYISKYCKSRCMMAVNSFVKHKRGTPIVSGERCVLNMMSTLCQQNQEMTLEV